ncbi:uncharacterized protein BDZ99DRAFT_465695 [Mytilinidion resinicola]|uniref:Uncharacterized protein n=1 Tax=Mytilinidion resinicola TaxID=574789 RepID=A0A6A6YFZ6_9PEZI|nr:uncharacterized protein BDZ99DRAFT_465695 [Mytilinidion resinicola]KAF2806944.1 hypothetical protein BDZ99DRAFT_465695 [Mytilinidion resinicola]
MGSSELLSLGSDALSLCSGCAHPAQPQLRLEREQLRFLDGKGNCLGAHWDIVLPIRRNREAFSQEHVSEGRSRGTNSRRKEDKSEIPRKNKRDISEVI